MTAFAETNPTTDAYWRSIILFGKNSASYKFALGKSLLEAAEQDKTFFLLEELAEPYARIIPEHNSARGVAHSNSPNSVG